MISFTYGGEVILMNKKNKTMNKSLKFFLVILIVANLSILLGIFFTLNNDSSNLTYAKFNNNSNSSLPESEEYTYKKSLLNNVDSAIEHLYEVESLNNAIGDAVLSIINKNNFSGSALSKLVEPLNKLNKLELSLDDLSNNTNDNFEKLIKLSDTYKNSALIMSELVFNNTESNTNIVKTFNEQIDISNEADKSFMSTITELLDKLGFTYELTDDGINYKLN